MSDPRDDFEILDHTADLGLRAHGPDLSSLFSNAARGMFSVITDLDSIQPTQPVPVSLNAESLDDLLVAWLSELLYLFSTRSMLFCRFEISEIDDHHIQATAFGQPIDPSCHELLTEIKAVTYHDLKLEKLNDAWQTSVLFDI